MKAFIKGFFTGFFKIRNEPTVLGKLAMSLLCLAAVGGLWTAVTRGMPEARVVSPSTLGSPEEVFGSFHALWFDRAFMRNLVTSIIRVFEGFGIALLVGLPVGILSGTFFRVEAFFGPISIFGRYVPIYALVPLAFLWFGGGEPTIIGFLFMACVAFVVFDTGQNIRAVANDYLDTAYTLGASRVQVLTKVLIPLAMPEIFNSMRLLFGLCFGYIIVVEALDMSGGGVGVLIMQSQRRGPREHVYLILLLITAAAFLIDRLLFTLQRALFPYRYGR